MADSTPSPARPSRRTRGPTTLAGFERQTPPAGHAKWPIEYDLATGQARGPYKNLYSSYSSLLVRSKISIAYRRWKDVEAELKDLIWTDITVSIYKKRFSTAIATRILFDIYMYLLDITICI